MGIVEEIGAGVDRIAVGDRVSVPFNIACGTCRNCVAGWTCACLRANPSGRPTAGWASDIIAHLGYGAAVYATLTALDTETEPGRECRKRAADLQVRDIQEVLDEDRQPR